MNDRPCMRVGGRFASEVPGVEFRKRGLDIVDVERYARREPLVGVDFDDAEHLQAERLGLLIAAPYAGTREREALPARGDDDEVNFVTPTSTMARMFASWASRPRRIPLLTTRRRSSSHTSSAIISAMASQSLAARYALKRTYISARRVLEPRRRKAELVESCKRGVDV